MTASLAALGLATPFESDRMATSQWNARGNFESRALKDLNDRLLFSRVGPGRDHRRSIPGWESDGDLD